MTGTTNREVPFIVASVVAAESHKTRLRELARQVMPTLDDAVTGELSVADIAVLERYADPRALLRAGRSRLLSLIHKASWGHQGAERADRLAAGGGCGGRALRRRPGWLSLTWPRRWLRPDRPSSVFAGPEALRRTPSVSWWGSAGQR